MVQSILGFHISNGCHADLQDLNGLAFEALQNLILDDQLHIRRKRFVFEMKLNFIKLMSGKATCHVPGSGISLNDPKNGTLQKKIEKKSKRGW